METPERQATKNPMAFPWTGQGVWVPEKGMSLRDYFAAKAMQALIDRGSFDGERDSLAAHAYGVADWMLKERSK